MARPTVTHDGFLVPNAATVSNPRMAEPDQVDFNIGAHALWGVVDNCLVTVAGSTASTLGGTVVINGVMITLNNSTAQLGVGGAQDRFDLLVADIGGVLKVIPGTPSVDPVYPDPPLNATVLAAVFCPAGLNLFTDNVIDKRKFITKALLTKIATGDPLVRNMNGSGNHFLVQGDGKTIWEADTWMLRSGVSELTIHSDLRVEDHIDAASLATTGDVAAIGNVYGANLMRGPSLPGTAANGTIFQQDNGRLWIRKNGAWTELATVDGTVPMGTIIHSMRPKSEMLALGWVPLDGSTLAESGAYPALFTLFLNLGYTATGTSPNRTIVLPNSTGRVLLNAVTPGVLGGPTSNLITLSVSQMPAHKHSVGINYGGGATPVAHTSRGGVHNHAITGGAHGHPVTDPGHAHHGADFFGNASPFICLMWGGNNKIDALFNDRNHTYSVEAMDWITPAVTNITIGSAGSEHSSHVVSNEGDHDHVVSIDPIAAHVHTVSESTIGSGLPIDITPMYLTTITYIRS